MIHFLRRDDRTIVDVSATEDDIHVVIVIDEYSYLLMDVMAKWDCPLAAGMVRDFRSVQELRGEYHEINLMKEAPETPDELAARRLMELGEKYGLQYVTD